MLGPQSSDPVLHIVGHLHPNLHPHHQGVWEHGTQLDQQPPIATACTASFYNVFLNWEDEAPSWTWKNLFLETTYIREFDSLVSHVGVEFTPVKLRGNA